MDTLATLGDSFVKLIVSLSIYHQYVSGDVKQPSVKKDNEVSNKKLGILARSKALHNYLNSTEVVFNGNAANWLPPGYKIDGSHRNRFLIQEINQKTLGDMIEAIIGALLISTDYSTTIKFMHWLGLDVIWIEQNGKNYL